MDLSELKPWPGIRDKTVLITGATRGIGRALAAAFGGQGATVVGTATTDAGARELSEWLESANFGGRGYVLDVASQASVEGLFVQLAAADYLPSILINNAGITRDNLLMRMKEAEWDDVISTDLSSLFRLCKAVLKPMLRARGGRIINITSVVGQIGNAGQSNYAAAKAGIIGFTRSLARELASRQITVNAIAPGFIETDMTAALDGEQTEALSRQIPLGRLGQPADIAAAAVFLASDAAAYMTGQTLNVNGGLHMA
jgi:3-oxoacyl-[acyl-carrier protein] reductase